jgi:hypothetical protein
MIPKRINIGTPINRSNDRTSWFITRIECSIFGISVYACPYKVWIKYNETNIQKCYDEDEHIKLDELLIN